MRPQQPPSSPERPAAAVLQAGSERMGLMVKATAELAIEIGLGGSPAGDRIAVWLLGELRASVPERTRERGCGRAMTRLLLDGMADKLEAAADRRGLWPRGAGDGLPLRNETQLRALIARLRLVARN